MITSITSSSIPQPRAGPDRSFIPLRPHMSSETKSRICLVNATTNPPPSQVPHLLPCHIKYSGPAPVSEFFKPTRIPSDPSLSEAYFRGRKVIGTEVQVPAKYRGMIYDSSAKPPSTRRVRANDDDGIERAMESDEEVEEVAEWMEITRFQKLMVYGNGEKVDEERNAVVKGLSEWIQLANVIHHDVE